MTFRTSSLLHRSGREPRVETLECNLQFNPRLRVPDERFEIGEPDHFSSLRVCDGERS
jgi:hypothetical protein